MLKRTSPIRNHIDLREEHEAFIQEYGHFVLLQRNDKKFRCRCWSETYREADSKCPYCTGNGYIFRIEKIKARKQTATQTESRVNLLIPTPMGDLHYPAHFFFVPYHVKPRAGDKIIEVGWNDFGKPTHVNMIFEINDVLDKRADDGRVEYYQCTGREQKAPLDVVNIAVRKWGMTENYEFKYRR